MSIPSDGPPREEPGRSPWDRPPEQPGQPYGAPGQPPPGPAPYGPGQPYGPPGQPGQGGYGPPGPPPGHGQPDRPGYGQPEQPYGQPGQPYGPPGQAPYGQAPYGQTPDPNAPYGQAPPGQAPYGQTPDPNAPYGQPPKKSRRPLYLIVGGVLAAIVVLVVVLGALGLGARSPRHTADEFMAALKAKDVGKAHSLLCKDGQGKESEDALRGTFGLDTRTITDYSLGTEHKRKREGKDETLIPVTIDYDRGPQVQLDLGVWNEGGQKVCSLNRPGES